MNFWTPIFWTHSIRMNLWTPSQIKLTFEPIAVRCTEIFFQKFPKNYDRNRAYIRSYVEIYNNYAIDSHPWKIVTLKEDSRTQAISLQFFQNLCCRGKKMSPKDHCAHPKD